MELEGAEKRSPPVIILTLPMEMEGVEEEAIGGAVGGLGV
jgi:hypothetical protein